MPAVCNEQKREKLLQWLGGVRRKTRRTTDVIALGLTSRSAFNHLSWRPGVRRNDRYHGFILGFRYIFKVVIIVSLPASKHVDKSWRCGNTLTIWRCRRIHADMTRWLGTRGWILVWDGVFIIPHNFYAFLCGKTQQSAQDESPALRGVNYRHIIIHTHESCTRLLFLLTGEWCGSVGEAWQAHSLGISSAVRELLRTCGLPELLECGNENVLTQICQKCWWRSLKWDT